MSRLEDVPVTVPRTRAEGEIAAVTVKAPTSDGTMRDAASPCSSVVRAQVEVPQLAKITPAGLALRVTVAPATGVTPSASITRTRSGFGASPPTGVAGLAAPCRSRILSSDLAP